MQSKMDQQEFDDTVSYVENIGIDKFIPSDDEQFPGSDVVILWDHSDGIFLDEGVCVIHSLIGSRNHVTPEYSKLPLSDGNICAGWMEGGDYGTPARDFGDMIDGGFSSPLEYLKALRQFAHIRECDWARQMIRGSRAYCAAEV